MKGPLNELYSANIIKFKEILKISGYFNEK